MQTWRNLPLPGRSHVSDSTRGLIPGSLCSWYLLNICSLMSRYFRTEQIVHDFERLAVWVEALALVRVPLTTFGKSLIVAATQQLLSQASENRLYRPDST